MQQRRRRRRRRVKKRFLVILLVLVLLVAGAFGTAYGLMSASASRAVNAFNEYYDAGNYSEARKAWTNADQSLKGWTQSRVNSRIEQKLDETIDAFFEQAQASELPADHKGLLALQEFIKETKKDVASKLDKSVDSYIAKEISYEHISNLLTNLNQVGYGDDVMEKPTATVKKYYESRTGFAEGKRLEEEGDFAGALAAYGKVIKEEKDDYADAQLRISALDAKVSDELITQADALIAKGRYWDAEKLFADLDEDTKKLPEIAAKLTEIKTKQEEYENNLVEYNGTVEHLFTHALIAFPDMAVAGNTRSAMDNDCLFVSEFKAILEQLYENNYILIDINDTIEITEVDGKEKISKAKLMLPEGKKPLILSFDDIVYDPRKRNAGMIDKLIVKDGKVQTYTKIDATGEEIISDDNECVPILDNFVAEHPDFSFKGAKGTLCITGFCGVLGYRTHRESPNRDSEIAAAKEVVQVLKDSGWNFASHDYAHKHVKQASTAEVEDDATKWDNESKNVLGETQVFVWPYGEWVAEDDERHQVLIDHGFRIFCGVGGMPYMIAKDQTLFMDRRPMDGYSLRNFRQKYLDLFDTRTVFNAELRNQLNPEGGSVKD